MRHILLVLGVLCVLLLVGCGGGGGNNNPGLTTGSVEGYVYSDAGEQLLVAAASRANLQPVNGARVAVRGMDTLTITTDATGHFRIDNVPYGSRQLDVSHDGFARIAVPVVVNAPLVSVSYVYQNQPAPYKWTVMVYMNGDNNMEPYGILDFNELEQIGSTEDVKVLVQFDRTLGYDSSNGDWSEARRYEVQKDTNTSVISSPLLERLGEVDMGNPQTLKSFITWGQTYAPAEHYLVVVWDHGSGWSSSEDRSRAISNDSSSGSVIRDVDLTTALSVRDPLDVVAMDACLMSMLEIGYQIRHQADYLVASQDTSPLPGYAYQRVLAKLTSESASITPAELAAFMAQDAYQEWTGSAYYVTSSALDLTKIDTVATALDTLAGRLIEVVGNNRDGVLSAQSGTEKFNGGAGDTLADLSHYASLIETYVRDSKAREAAKGVRTAISNVVLFNKADHHPQSRGISIYLPTLSEYMRYGDDIYPQLDLCKDTRWNEWLLKQPQL